MGAFRARSLVLLLVVLMGCPEDAQRAETPPQGPPLATAPAPVARPPSRAATAASFDLTQRPGGAWLLLAPADAPGRVTATPLGAMGEVAGPPAVVTAGGEDRRVVEVVGAAAGGDLVVGWIVARPGASPFGIETSGGSGGVFGPVQDLGPTAMPPTPGVPGGLVMAFHAGRAGPVVFHRGPPTPCQAGAAPDAPTGCTGVRRRSLDRAGAVVGDDRAGVGLALPAPCAVTLPGLVRVEETSFYGLCDESLGVPETALYTIQREPRYARADPVLRGCRPRGLVAVGRASWVLGDCGEASAPMVVEAKLGGGPPVTLGVSETSIVCEAGRPRIVLPGAGRSLLLGAPRDGLGPLFGPPAAPRRAVWTGDALLIAGADRAGVVQITRHHCDDGRLLTAAPEAR